MGTTWPRELRKFVAPEFVFGWGARRLIGQYAANLEFRRVLVVSDPGVAAAGWTHEVMASLDGAYGPHVLLTEVTPNPTDEQVMSGAALFAARECSAIVAVGGGSVIDCAKSIGIVAGNGGHIRDYEGVDRIPMACPPIVCVPTTAGTSADISQFAIITNTAEHYKMAIVSKAAIADIALVDAETTVTMPPTLTASTGLDALGHAAEALASNASSPMTDLNALEAARLIRTHLLRAVAEPASYDDRTGMMLASLLAGLAFSNASLGAAHAMAHSLAAVGGAAHGDAVAILLRHVVAFNYEAAPQAYDRLAVALGIDVDGLGAAARRDVLVSAIGELTLQSGAPTTLAAIGLSRDDIGICAARALKDPCFVTNPRPATRADVEDLYERAFEG